MAPIFVIVSGSTQYKIIVMDESYEKRYKFRKSILIAERKDGISPNDSI